MPEYESDCEYRDTCHFYMAYGKAAGVIDVKLSDYLYVDDQVPEKMEEEI